MSSRRRSISRNTRPRSVKIPISFLHASARRFVDSIAVDIPASIPGAGPRRRCIAAAPPPSPRAIFEWTMHFSGTRRNRSPLSGAISRVGTREEKGRKTGSRRQRSAISLSDGGSTMRERRGEKVAGREGEETRFHNHRWAALPLVRSTIIGGRCEIERLI